MKEKLSKKIFGGKPGPKPWKPPHITKSPQTPEPEPASQGLYPRKVIEPIISRPMQLDEIETELLIRLHDADGDREIKSCYGDIYKIINALMDYARLLETTSDEWDLQGYHRAVYEIHAEKLRAIAKKYQTAIGYDYDAAVARCEARRKREHKNEDVGGDALELAVKKGRQSSTKPLN